MMDGGRSQELQLFLSGTKGAALSIVVAMLAMGRPLGVGDLQVLCPYSRRSLSVALQKLAGLGLVMNHRRYGGWLLTCDGRQMILGEGQFPTVDAGLLGTSSLSLSPDLDKEGTTTTTSDGQILPLAGAEGEVARAIVEVGAAPAAAGRAVSAAVAGGLSVGDVRDLVEGWLVYCGSPRGRSIRNPGALICARLPEGVGAPKQASSLCGDRGRGLPEGFCPTCYRYGCAGDCE